ncbi:hypothetical protein HanPSC8_Chr17g0786341 [Helianthus annuus]|nr:hypothetical protein HanPSC8_Chr17g0786341 [Helianthus annuus]
MVSVVGVRTGATPATTSDDGGSGYVLGYRLFRVSVQVLSRFGFESWSKAVNKSLAHISRVCSVWKFWVSINGSGRVVRSGGSFLLTRSNRVNSVNATSQLSGSTRLTRSTQPVNPFDFSTLKMVNV